MIVLPSTSYCYFFYYFFVIFVSSFLSVCLGFFLISESNLLYAFYSKIGFALLLTFLSVLTFCCFSPFSISLLVTSVSLVSFPYPCSKFWGYPKGEVRYFVSFPVCFPAWLKKFTILFLPLITAKSALPQWRAKKPFDWSPKGAWTEQQRTISQETGNCAYFLKNLGL